MLYRPPTQTATPAVLRFKAEAPRITGHKVARRVAGETQAARAADAADLYFRGFALWRPTVKQWAAICGVSAATVHAALRLTPGARACVRAGLRPLIETKAANPVQPALPMPQALTRAWSNASASEREAFVEAAGVAAIWDTIEKVIA